MPSVRHFFCSLPLALVALVVLSGCGEKTPPCAICYEDEWSREPFPGQPKQHIKPLTPEDLQQGAVPHGTREFLGTSAREGDSPY